MSSASALRLQIESTLSRKIPSGLTPAPKMMRPVAADRIEPLDDVLRGGLPVGAISEMVGPECSGRTSVALSFLAQMTQAGKVCCWIDVANTFDPASAGAIGVDLTGLLWVRCGVLQTTAEREARNFVLPENISFPLLPRRDCTVEALDHIRGVKPTDFPRPRGLAAGRCDCSAMRRTATPSPS